MSDNFFILFDWKDSFGISRIMEESCYFFFQAGLAIFSFNNGSVNPSLDLSPMITLTFSPGLA